MSSWIEWIGYLASFTIAISLLMTDLVKLRLLNSVGCLIFVIYGIMVGAYPVAVANAAIILINGYHLWKLKKSK